jgi:hypothetical protein
LTDRDRVRPHQWCAGLTVARVRSSSLRLGAVIVLFVAINDELALLFNHGTMSYYLVVFLKYEKMFCCVGVTAVHVALR